VSDHDGPVTGGNNARSTISDVPLSFEELRRVIARELNVDERIVAPEATFEDTLYADSIRLAQPLLRLSQQGITIPMEEAWSVETAGETYKVYCRHAGSGAPKADASVQCPSSVRQAVEAS
jgi:acyl carrier protein